MEKADDLPTWVLDLGISDITSAVEIAAGHWTIVRRAGISTLREMSDITTAGLVFTGLLARAQGLHQGSVDAVRNDNPYAAFTLLRSMSENAAAIFYATEHPDKIDRFWNSREGRGIPIGKITSFASKRMENFRPIYDQLSQHAHPHSTSILSAFEISEEDTLTWTSVPHFRSDRDKIFCCAWICELSVATAHLLHEFAERFALDGGSRLGPSDAETEVPTAGDV